MDVARADSAPGRNEGANFANLKSDFQKLRNLNRPPGNPMLQGLPLKQFHGNKRPPLEIPHIINSANIRMIQSRSSPSLAPESLDSLRVLRNIIRKELQRHATAKPRILGLVNHTHPPAAKLLDDLIMGDSPPNNRRSVCHSPEILRLQPNPSNRATETPNATPGGW